MKATPISLFIGVVLVYALFVVNVNAGPSAKHDLLRSSLSLNPVQDFLNVFANQGNNGKRSTQLCDYQRFHRVVSGIEDLIDSLDSARDLQFLSEVLDAISGNFTQSAACLDVVGYIVEVANQTTVYSDTRVCHIDESSPAYATDPCCNATLTLTQCCEPRDVSTTSNYLVGFRDVVVATQCKQGALVKDRFTKFFIDFQDGMEICTQLNGFDAVAYASVVEPLIQCYASVVEGRSCSSSADCYNGSYCVPFANICTVPYDSLAAPVIQCITDRIAGDVARVLRRDLGLTILDSDDEFKQHLVNYLTVDSCRGPTAELYPTQKTACEAAMSCNDASIHDETNCTGTFCSFCYAPNICANIPLENCTAICSNGQFDIDECNTTYVCSQQCDGSSCTTEEACEAQGSCNDDELLTGVCVSPFLADGSGHPTCVTDAAKLQVGCLETSYLSSGACTGAGFTWRTRASSTAECAAQGSFCQMADYSWDLSLKSATDCAACGGTIVPAYKWQPALWVPGFVLPLEEIDRVWTPVNTWGPTLDSSKLSEIVNAIVVQKFIPVVKTMLQCAYLPYLTILDEAVCACSGDPTVPADCFASTSTAAQIAEGIVFSGIEATILSNGVTAVFTNTSITVQDDAKNISIYIVIPPAVSSSKRDTTAASSNSVVDGNGAVIGQLYGNQIQVSFPNTLSGSGFSLCIDIVSPPTGCNSAAMAYASSADTASVVATTTVTVSGDQMCANGLTQAGYYAPAYLCTQSTGSGSGAQSTTSGAGASGGSGATTTGNAATHSGSVKISSVSVFLLGFVGMVLALL